MIQEIQLSASLQNRDRDRTDEAVYLIATYLDLHFAENPDLETLARHHGMSYRTFLRRWNALFSLTPALAIRKRKIREACRLLEETSLKIYEIAARVGFEDPYYFMRIFHADMKQSPSRYRKALRGTRGTGDKGDRKKMTVVFIGRRSFPRNGSLNSQTISSSVFGSKI